MNDPQIRPILHAYLREINKTYEDTKIVDELDLCHGLSRVDIAVINGIIHGYEIKSDVDSLIRLSNQIKYYNKSLEKVTVAITTPHFKKTICKIPEWWGVLIINKEQEKISFKEYRVAEINPSLDNSSLLFLLWKNELNLIIEKFRLSSKKKDNKKILSVIIMQNLNQQEISYEVREALKSRKNWRSCSTTTVK